MNRFSQNSVEDIKLATEQTVRFCW